MTPERERNPTRQVATFGVFGPPEAVACVTDFPPHLQIREGKAIIQAAGKKITLPAAALPAIRAMLSGQPVDIHQITTATGIEAAPLIAVLIEEGICAEITPDLAEGYAGMLTS